MADNKISLSWLARVFVGLLLIFGFTAGYYWSHKPISPTTAFALVETIFSILVFLLVVWIASAIGSIFVKQKLFGETSIAYLALTAGIGLGLLSLLVFTLGILGLLSSWIAWLSLIILAGLLRKQLKDIFTQLRTVQFPRPQTMLQKWILAFGVLMFFIALINALAPPTAWDSLVYHLAGPKLYIEAGRIGHPINNHYLGFPPLGSMQFLLALQLAGERAAALFHFVYGIFALVLIVELAKRYFDQEAAWHAALVFISIPTIFNLIGLPYTDGTLLFYATAPLYVFLRWAEQQVDEWLVPLGLLLGFAVSVKYTALAIPLTIALMIVWLSRNSGLMPVLRRLSILTLVALVVSAPYFLENLITTGNPFYPFLLDNGIYWDSWRSAFYDRPGTGFAFTAPLRLLLAPIEATILGIDGAAGFGATIGPLLFTGIFILPLAWNHISQQEKRTLAYLIFFIGVNYTLWLFGLARSALLLQSRLLMPMFGAMAVVSGLALARVKQLTRPQLEFRWLLNAILYINIALLLVTAASGFLQANPIPVTVGLESKQDFLERRLGLYRIVIEELNQLPADARVLFLWEPRSYHCKIDCWPDALLDNFLHQTQHYQRDAAGIASDWRAGSFTHVLLFQAGLDAAIEIGHDTIDSEDLAILDDLQAEELKLLEDFNGAYKLFAIQEKQ